MRDCYGFDGSKWVTNTAKGEDLPDYIMEEFIKLIATNVKEQHEKASVGWNPAARRHWISCPSVRCLWLTEGYTDAPIGLIIWSWEKIQNTDDEPACYLYSFLLYLSV